MAHLVKTVEHDFRTNECGQKQNIDWQKGKLIKVPDCEEGVILAPTPLLKTSMIHKAPIEKLNLNITT